MRHGLTKRGDGIVDIKRVHHISIHQPWSVHKRHQAEFLLLGGGNLSAQVIRDTYNIQLQVFIKLRWN